MKNVFLIVFVVGFVFVFFVCVIIGIVVVVMGNVVIMVGNVMY